MARRSAPPGGAPFFALAKPLPDSPGWPRNRRLGLARPRLCRPLKQCAGIDIQDRRQPVDHIDCRAVSTAFQRADVGAINIGLVSQRLLRQALRVSSLPQIAGEDLSYVHTPEASALSCISPRSMLDNRRSVDCNRATGVSETYLLQTNADICNTPFRTVENLLRGCPEPGHRVVS
jgi:hypothetical protein